MHSQYLTNRHQYQKENYEPSPAQERFYDIMEDHVVEKNDGIDEDELRKAVTYMKSDNDKEHERNIKYIIQDDDYKLTWENKDATVATGSRTITYSSDSDKNTAARKEPIKDTQTIKEPIKGPNLGKRARHSMDEPTNTDPVFAGVGIIGQGGSRNISRVSHNQSIVQGGESIIHSDVITHVLTNFGELTLESDSFTFDPLKAETLMVAPIRVTAQIGRAVTRILLSG